MLELRLVQGSILKKALEPIRDLVNDANFDFSETEFSIQGHSPMAVVMLWLRADGFEKYRCDRSVSMGMNLASVAKMLKCADNEDVISIKAEDESDTVTFILEPPNHGKITELEMHLMDIDTERLDIPEPEHDAIVTMPSAKFASICSGLSSIGKTVVISVTHEGVKFSTTGEVASANFVFRQSNADAKPEEATVIKVNKPVTLPFSLRYMNSFIKATPLSTVVKLSLSSDFPIVVGYSIADKGFIQFYLAPKIEEEENES
ncbi:Proliferating cell nuclear antigen [Bienertia sinuspersici]